MCRLFGFRSVINSQVHRSLVGADNAIAVQSMNHPDGWGVAYYVDGSPHVTKSSSGAVDDTLFRRVSGIVSSETVVAHIRKATKGQNSVLNSHPFQHGKWVFAHNGDIPGFHGQKAALEDAIAPRLRRFILGDTDSERVFFLFLTELSKYGPVSGRFTADDVVASLRDTVSLVRRLCDDTDGATERSLLTLLVTDGSCLAAVHGGKELYYSTYKRRCADRDTCPSLAHACEHSTDTGFVNHLIVSSEPLSGENIWLEMSEGDIISVDWRMRLVNGDLKNPQAV